MFTSLSLVDHYCFRMLTQDLDPRLHPIGQSKILIHLIAMASNLYLSPIKRNSNISNTFNTFSISHSIQHHRHIANLRQNILRLLIWHGQANQIILLSGISNRAKTTHGGYFLVFLVTSHTHTHTHTHKHTHVHTHTHTHTYTHTHKAPYHLSKLLLLQNCSVSNKDVFVYLSDK